MNAAIDAAVAHIRDVNDAVADLALAEGVHQAVIGNYDRSAGTLEAFAKGGLPPEVDVIRTPRSGTSLTLRTAIHLDPTATANPIAGVPMSPMASAEPVLNAWLGARLPAGRQRRLPRHVGGPGDRRTGAAGVRHAARPEAAAARSDLPDAGDAATCRSASSTTGCCSSCTRRARRRSASGSPSNTRRACRAR